MSLHSLGLGEKPGRVKGQGEWRPVGVVVMLKVVVEQLGHLLRLVDVGAGGNVVAAGYPLTLPSLLPAVELIGSLGSSWSSRVATKAPGSVRRWLCRVPYLPFSQTILAKF